MSSRGKGNGKNCEKDWVRRWLCRCNIVWCRLLQAYEWVINRFGTRKTKWPKTPKIGRCALVASPRPRARAAKFLEHLLKYYNWANYRQRLWRPVKPYECALLGCPQGCFSKLFQRHFTQEQEGFHILKLKTYSKYTSVNSCLLFYLSTHWPPHDTTPFTGRLCQFIQIMSTLGAWQGVTETENAK